MDRARAADGAQPWTYLDRDGTRLAVALTLAPIYDAGHRLPGYVVVARRAATAAPPTASVPERLLRQAEAAEARFRALLESVPDAIVIVDREGRIVLVNRPMEAMFGYARSARLGQYVEVRLPDSRREWHARLRRDYSVEPRARPMGAGLDLVARHQSGRVFPVEVSLSPITLDGELLVTSVIRDVSAQSAIERQKDEFLANVSHDLRTPLTAIKASIGVVLANEPPGTPEPLHRMFTNIGQAVDRMIELVSDLLELTRLQAGRVQLPLHRCDLRDLARRCIQEFEPLTRARGPQLRLALPAEPCIAPVDGDRLERALLNLLSNAHKYGQAGGTLAFTLTCRPAEAIFSVHDDGPGIPPSELPHIFERFYRAAIEATRWNHGSGLGLPIARAMVELHGGRIWAENAAAGGEQSSIWRSRSDRSRPRPSQRSRERMVCHEDPGRRR